MRKPIRSGGAKISAPLIKVVIDLGSHPAQVTLPLERKKRANLPAEGIEPTHSCEYWILSPARLPVPPRRRVAQRVKFTRYSFRCRKSIVDSMLTVWHDFGYQKSQ
jgi:hypothetical protein